MLTTRPRGTNDILPGQVEKWHYLEQVIRKICREYGYAEIRTPIFEHTELFQRGVGETTDIVEKEMYTFFDRGERSITLRPEGTAPAVRAYIENKLYAQPQPTKIYYVGPMFRYDRPQAGRFRQFHQFGVEVFGVDDPAVDAEVMAMAMGFYDRLGLQQLELHVNSVGCPVCRAEHRRLLQDFLRSTIGELCENCRGRFERNPLRILDCKSPACRQTVKGAPTTTTCLCPECRQHFAAVLTHLDLLEVKYQVDENLVRGLDYYTRTAFEIMAADIGAQSSIGGGGRYNGLVAECGGPETSGIGYAMGLERILAAMERQEASFPQMIEMDVFIAAMGEAANVRAFVLLADLRRRGLAAEKDYLGRSLKAQMKYAGKFNTPFVVILGEEELQRQVAVVRDMTKANQAEVPLDQVGSYLQTCLNKV